MKRGGALTLGGFFLCFLALCSAFFAALLRFFSLFETIVLDGGVQGDGSTRLRLGIKVRYAVHVNGDGVM